MSKNILRIKFLDMKESPFYTSSRKVGKSKRNLVEQAGKHDHSTLY